MILRDCFFVKFIERLESRLFVFSLILATAVYYILTRLWQNSLEYASPDAVDLLPGTMFFPEPYEIPIYLVGYLVIPIAALGLSWVIQKVSLFCHSRVGGNPETKNKSQKTSIFFFWSPN